MFDLDFQVDAAEPERVAVAPLLLFKLKITERQKENASLTAVHSIMLRCQIRLEPARRRYQPSEQEKLLDLFGTPERWGQTLRPMLWTHADAIVPSFTGSTIVDLPVPCSYDFNVAGTKYFGALDGGEIPLCFLFSGTIFYEGADGALQVAQIPWEKEAGFRLPVTVWRNMMNLYYPNSAWLCLRQDVFDRLNQYRSQRGLPTSDLALEKLLQAEETVSP